MPVQETRALASGGATDESDVPRSILDRIGASPTLQSFLARLKDIVAAADQDESARTTRLQLAGLAGSALPMVVAHAYRATQRTVVVVAADPQQADALRDDLELVLGTDRVLYLPEFESLAYDVRSPHLSVLEARTTALSRLALGHEAVVVTTARSLVTQVPSPEVLRRGIMPLAVGDPMDADELAEWLAGLAFKRVPLAEAHGDFARRGGILDVFTFGYTNPLRIEFEDDEVLSIREYDATTQRSVRRHERILLVPRREMVIDEDVAGDAADRLRALAGPEATDAEALALQLEHELYFVDMRRIASYIEQGWGSVLRYVPRNALVVRSSPRRMAEEATTLAAAYATAYDDRRRHHEMASDPHSLLVPWEEVDADLEARAGFDVDPVIRSRVRLDVELPEELRKLTESGSDQGNALEEAMISGSDLPATPHPTPALRGEHFHFHTTPQEHFGRSMDRLRSFLDAQHAARNDALILCDNPGQRDRLRELIQGDDGDISGAIPPPLERHAPPDDTGGSSTGLEIEVGQLAGGFTWREVRLVVLTDHEIFARFRRRRVRRRFKAGISIPSLNALKVGDLVVHMDHGVGRYIGTQRVTTGGHETDCLQIEYQRGDKLFVPVDQFDLIQRYSTEEGKKSPGLSRIGGTAWQKTKAKAEKAIADMTEELLKTQAIRSKRPGFRFSEDNVWQRQLESSFIYDDTPDQAKATTDIKKDMESTKPMDRLVCGDVGFGKTEVAIRAAFKAVQDGKQVALLVPTTILASQHYQTLTERLAEFPVRIELLSRFRTAAQQKDVVAELKLGQVDIVIGTHRLLSKDVEFKDLGLIVVDEEQRFGVRNKERLKQFKEVADVLTLTATPIPRTMHQALLGTRDISLITTPPRDRVPVATEIVEFDRDLIADALLREADRGGQAFFVHNRVQSINATARFLQRICPQLSYGIAHGQMSERDLERVIVEFVDQKYDVLVTTMIIESGIDMPSVNTMLINRADRFGLAQLYQLRGRVGRSNQRAYCHLMVPPHRALTEISEKRLRAIEEYDELGSGIKVAMKDLEIRGAGNILGSQQHGHMVAIGYDLYCRMLDESIRKLQGDAVETIETRVTTSLDAYLADELIESTSDKIEFYKRLAETTQESEVDELIDELADRYGKIDETARNIFELRRVKLMAGSVGIEELDVGASRVRFEFWKQPSKARIAALMKGTSQQFEFSHGERFVMKATQVGDDPLGVARSVLELLASVDADSGASGEA